jgi:dTDP-4-dehydrorhamnose 3,5-epimerase-like enzyme
MAHKFSIPAMNADERGGFWQIAQTGWSEINFAETVADKYRGNHFHKENQELFFITEGQVEVTLRSIHEPQPQTILVSKGEAILIEPYEFHIFYTRRQTQWIVLLSQGINPESPDFYGLDEFEKVLKQSLRPSTRLLDPVQPGAMVEAIARSLK